MRRIIFFALLLGSVFACESEAVKSWNTLDLMSEGLPIAIHAPDSAKVKNNSAGMIKDITIKKGNDFDIQIFASPITSSTLADLKTTQLEEVKGNRYFSKIITDETNGFVYENAIDSSTIYYGFRYVYYQAELEYVFQQGLSGIFSKEDAEGMYEAVKQEKK